MKTASRILGAHLVLRSPGALGGVCQEDFSEIFLTAHKSTSLLSL